MYVMSCNASCIVVCFQQRFLFGWKLKKTSQICLWFMISFCHLFYLFCLKFVRRIWFPFESLIVRWYFHILTYLMGKINNEFEFAWNSISSSVHTNCAICNWKCAQFFFLTLKLSFGWFLIKINHDMAWQYGIFLL